MTSTCIHGHPWSYTCERCDAENVGRRAGRVAALGRLCRDMREVADQWPDPVRSALRAAALVIDNHLTPGAP
jgi:hypothetical protein